ncbi:MAG: hypothetical protein Kow0099_21760 [Candidatus Abyssubacteria bacterium]
MKADKKTILAVVLGLVAVGVVGYQLFGVLPTNTSSARNAVAAPTPSPIVSAPQSAEAVRAPQPKTQLRPYEELIAKLEEDDLPYRDKSFRNPMAPLVSEAKPKEAAASFESPNGPLDALAMGYTIEGIVWNDVQPLAIVNNKVVAVGESLDDGALVTNITPDLVSFRKSGRTYYLAIQREENR